MPGITHDFTSPKDDGGDATLLRPSDWNAEHLLDVAAPSGLTGATAPARFVGGTTSGAPITGAFEVGDFVIDQTGKVIICTVAGSPGTWGAVSGGADLVQVASGAGSVRIPGLKGSPDIPPSSPSAYDDEFDTTLSGSWTVLGSLNEASSNVIPSHLYLKKTTNVNLECNGIYKAAPSMPFTVTAKVTDTSHNFNFATIGLMLTESSPGKLWQFGLAFHTGFAFWTAWSYSGWNSRTSRANWTPANGPYRKPYMRLIVASSTDITCQTSENGLVWVTVHTSVAPSPALTVANVGFLITGNEGTETTEAVIDWIRFT